jgi:hypothetical protein
MLGLRTDGEVATEAADGEGADTEAGPGGLREPVNETETDGVAGGEDIEAGDGDKSSVEEAEEIETDDVGMGDGSDRLASGIGLNRRVAGDENTDALGPKADVSKEISGPSGNAMDCTEGDAAKIDDS